jgi:hypothetical protein
MKMLSATPLLLLQPKLPPVETDPKEWSLVEQWKYARRFLYENRVDADVMLFVARLPIVALSLVLGVYVFRWSSELYGQMAGLSALFFYSFSPNILAHARLATHDLGLAAFMFIATYYFWRYMARPALLPLILCAVFAGLSLLTKTTAVFLAPIFAVYVLICVVRKNGLGIYTGLPWVGRINPRNTRGRQLLSGVFAFCVIGGVVLLTLNVGYGFQGTFQVPDTVLEGDPVDDGLSQDTSYRGRLPDIPLPVPAPFVQLVRFQSKLTAAAGGIYFAGKTYDAGLWYLMIVSYVIKTPIAAILLLGGAMFYLSRRARAAHAEWLLASFVSVIMLVFSFLGNVNVGLRYVLPIYPFIHVLISSLLRPGLVRSRVVGGMLVLLGGWYLVSSVAVYPHYLAYFNEFVSGPKHGYRYLVDSNLDWGQDLKGLKAYMDAHSVDRVSLGYFGSADADYYGIDYDYLPSVGLAPKRRGQMWWYEPGAGQQRVDDPKTELVAVSATMLVGPWWMKGKSCSFYKRLRECEPIDQIGYSILIFDSNCIAQR